MNYARTKKFGTMIIAILLLSLIMQNTNAQTVNSATTDKALALITDVLPLDKTKYNVSLALYNKPSAGTLSNSTEEYVTYNLENSGEVTTVRCTFQNDKLLSLIATAPSNAKLIYTQPSDNLLDLTKGILERYHIFLEDNSLSEMIQVLDTIDSVKNATITADDIKLEIITDSRGTVFYLKHIYNGCEYDEVSVAFPNDRRMMIGDMQSRYKMGDTTVKISEEQAIETAIKYIENYSYEAVRGTGENETKITVNNFNISREGTTTELAAAERDGLLYPRWKVNVDLEGLYPGNVYGFTVSIWADSGEFSKLGTLAVGADPTGIPIVDDLITNPSPQGNDTAAGINIGVIIAAITIAASVVVVTLLAVKKSRSK